MDTVEREIDLYIYIYMYTHAPHDLLCQVAGKGVDHGGEDTYRLLKQGQVSNFTNTKI